MEFDAVALTQHKDHLEFRSLPTNIYFVQQDEAEQRTTLIEAFNASVMQRDGRLKINWITEDQIPNVLPTVKSKKDTVFVCEEFHGRTFSLLRERNFWVIGPDCLVSQENPLRITEVGSSLPVYSFLMKRMTICFSGLSTTRNGKKLQEKVLLMGGLHTGPLRSTVTHLVTNSVNSIKYRAAIRAGIKVMRPSWIEELWKQSQLGSYTYRVDILAFLIQQHTLSYLEGLKICVCPMLNKKSGGSYESMVKSGGATLCQDLSDLTVTHYICEAVSANEIGTGIYHRVLPQWLLQCVRTRVCQDWSDYLVTESVIKPVTYAVPRGVPVGSNRKRALSPTAVSTTSLSSKRLPRRSIVVEVVSPVRVSPRLHGFVSTETNLNRSLGFTVPKPVKRSGKSSGSAALTSQRTPKTSRQKMPDAPTSSKLFYDENACDGQVEDIVVSHAEKTDILPPECASTSSQPQTPYPCNDSVYDTLFSSNPEDTSQLASQAVVRLLSPLKSDNLAKKLLNMAPKSQRRIITPRSPLKLSREKLLRPGRNSFDRAYQYGVAAFVQESPIFSRESTDSAGVEWEEEMSSQGSVAVPVKSSFPPSSVETISTDRKKIVFMVCRLKDYDKSKLAALLDGIKNLPAEYLHGTSFDEQCTHLLCERPHFTEKFLGCCAAGKWILSDQYVHDSVKAGCFLEEAQYEWGNVLAGKHMNGLNDSELRWASAGHFWRRQVQQSGKRAFDGWQVILGPEIPRLESYCNVLRAGNAVILTPTPEDASRATHLLHYYGKRGDEEKLQAFRDGIPGITVESYDKTYLDRFLLQRAIGATELRRAMALPSSAPKLKSQAFSQSAGAHHRLSGTLAMKRPRRDPPNTQIKKPL